MSEAVLRDGSRILVRPITTSDGSALKAAFERERQRRGLGTILLSRLADRAREQGIRRFEAQALSENRRVIGLLAKLGALTVRPHRAVSYIVIELQSA